MTIGEKDIPLYPTEAEIAVAVLGAKRARDWSGIVRHLEMATNFPLNDALMGGRFWPAVVAYFHERQKSVSPAPPPKTWPRIKAIPVKKSDDN